MKKLFERLLIKLAKIVKIDLLAHAHVQIGVGHNTYSSGEEFVLNSVLKKVLKRNPAVIFDVGANIGNYALELRKHFPNSTIYCFEPVEETFDILKCNTRDVKITCNKFGFSSEDETFNLFIGSNNSDGSMATAYPECIDTIFTFAGTTEKKVECTFTTLDSYCVINSINEIDFLKIDVEGHELQVLKGAKKMLSLQKIHIIQFEFNEFNIISRSFIKDFYEVLPQYSLYRIMPNNRLFPLGNYNSSLEIFRYQNILAINNNYIFPDAN